MVLDLGTYKVRKSTAPQKKNVAKVVSVTSAEGFLVFIVAAAGEATYTTVLGGYSNRICSRDTNALFKDYSLIDTASIVRGAGSMKRSIVSPSVRPSVCPIIRPQPRRAAGLMLSAA